MLTIIGGTYLEDVIDPFYSELYGSGLRAALALSKNVKNIQYVSALGDDFSASAKAICDSYGIKHRLEKTQQTAAFCYYHPLSLPAIRNWDGNKIKLTSVEDRNILYFGMLDASISVNAEYLVYDPQNHIRFSDTGCSAQHLAIVLNKNEAYMLSESSVTDDLFTVGEKIKKQEGATIVIIKNGSHGAVVFENDTIHNVPVYKTGYVWPIGSGDIFSAVFAWQWMIEKKSAKESADFASRYTATYCESRQLPLPPVPSASHPLSAQEKKKHIYIAGPFFTISERWLINEVQRLLLEFGNNVFSPLHDVGVEVGLDHNSIATADINGLKNSDTVLAIVSGLDSGTLFEIGYAVSLKKKVIVLAENVSKNDLTMIIGTDCIVTHDLTTAIYMASW